MDFKDTGFSNENRIGLDLDRIKWRCILLVVLNPAAYAWVGFEALQPRRQPSYAQVDFQLEEICWSKTQA
jgi:hypothetical protein